MGLLVEPVEVRADGGGGGARRVGDDGDEGPTLPCDERAAGFDRGLTGGDRVGMATGLRGGVEVLPPSAQGAPSGMGLAMCRTPAASIDG